MFIILYCGSFMAVRSVNAPRARQYLLGSGFYCTCLLCLVCLANTPFVKMSNLSQPPGPLCQTCQKMSNFGRPPGPVSNVSNCGPRPGPPMSNLQKKARHSCQCFRQMCNLCQISDLRKTLTTCVKSCQIPAGPQAPTPLPPYR